MERVVITIIGLNDAPDHTVGGAEPPNEVPHSQVSVLDKVASPDFKFHPIPRGANNNGPIFL